MKNGDGRPETEDRRRKTGDGKFSCKITDIFYLYFSTARDRNIYYQIREQKCDISKSINSN